MMPVLFFLHEYNQVLYSMYILKLKSASSVKKFDFTFLFRLLPTPGERTGERTATSVLLVGTMSVRLKHLWLVCGAGSQWRTCTTIITTIVADTFRDTADVKTPQRPFVFNLFSRVSEFKQNLSTSTKINPRAPEPCLFIRYFTLGINTTPLLFHLRTTLPTVLVTWGLGHQKKQTKINSAKIKLFYVAL